MPLTRLITVRPSGSDALSALVAASSVTRDLADMLQFTPVKAAATILLLIFETIQNVQTNKQDCRRLARRCLSLLVDMRDQLADHVDSAPPSLLKALSKFEETLESIYDFVKGAAEQKWSTRLIRKSTIENSLSDYNAALDDAARSFQIATLINIHLAVGDAPNPKKAAENAATNRSVMAKDQPSTSATLPPYTPDETEVISDVQELSASPTRSRSATMSSFGVVSRPASDTGSGSQLLETISVDLIDLSSPASVNFEPAETLPMIQHSAPEEEEAVDVITEHHGFSRYHQSQFRMKARSRVIKDGWWAGAVEGQINGQQSLMLRYEAAEKSAMKRFVRDVKLLQNVYHPNLPQMVGYSNDETPTPFILLANVQTRLPQALLLDSLKNASLARCAQLLVQFYRDTLDAALYYQQQLNLSDSKLQDYVEHASYRIDMEQTVIMGLPPPEVDNIVSWRNYGLAHSIRDIYLRLLPNRGIAPKEPVDPRDQSTSVEMQRKVNHLTVLARALLPSTNDLSVVQKRLHKLLGSLDDEEGEYSEVSPMSLREIRKAAIAADAHQQAWFDNSGIPPHKFSVGDLGYFPKQENSEERDWGNFVVLCNVLKEEMAKLDVSSATDGKQTAWQSGFHGWTDLPSFQLPDGVHGWTVVVPPEADLTLNIVHTNEVVHTHAAWNYLLDAGKVLAEKHGIQPEELILVTRAGVDQRFKIRDLRRIRYWPASHAPAPTHGFQSHFGHGHGMGGFHGHGHFGHQPFGGGNDPRRLIQGQDLAPKVFYLFTSGSKEHEPYFSLTPMHMPAPKGEKPPELDPNVVKCFALLDIAYGFLNYIQLHAEDFAE